MSLILLPSCNPNLDYALEQAGENREEIEKVLEHFRNDPDTLKYSAAKFLIENMSYHYALEGKGVESADSAYIAMAEYPKEQREKFFNEFAKETNISSNILVIDVRTVKADYLIKAVNDACDIWSKVNWNNDYDESLFFNYVLPYRVFDESYSDWHKSINEEFPYLNEPIVYSQKGIPFPAYTEQLNNVEIVELPSALKGKAVLLDKNVSSVTFSIESGHPTQKLLRFRYSSIEKDAKLLIDVNSENFIYEDLKATCNLNTFKSSSFGKVINLKKGENKIIVKFVNKSFILDYVEVASYESYREKECDDYAKSYCQVQNVNSNNYVSFDTLQSAIWRPIELHKYSSNDWTLDLRFDNLGYSIWHILPKFPVDLCLEDRWVSLDTLQAVSTNTLVDSNNGDAHQKWIIIPVGNGECKIMNKLTGLVWESSIDVETGKEILIQNFYSGKNTQKWRIIRRNPNPHSKSFFQIGNVLSEALRVTDVMKQFEFIKNRGSIAPTLASLCKFKTGICQDEAAFTVALSRYLGIPTAVDFVPHWGNRPDQHSWSVIVLPDGKATPFYMGFAPGDTAQYAHHYLKPKIFRRKFEINYEILSDLRNESSVPYLFKMPTFADVTDEYYETTDIKRIIPKNYHNHEIAYICVSDRDNWVPVHYGKIRGDYATFKSMGRNILYVVGIWENEHIKPVGDPFIIKADGTIIDVKCERKKTQSVTLYRKYPFFAKFDTFNGRMEYGRFYGSNKLDNTDADILYTHHGSTEGTWCERNLESSKRKYKYLRYIGDNGSYCNVNEIEFYDNNGKKITGKIIGTQGTDKHCKETVFDGNILTGFNGISPDGHWVGLELEKPSDVAKIRYMPRNDGNSIEVGDEYQLFVYDNGDWNELDVKIANDTKLVFKNVPKNGLFLLRDRTKGKEERVFTYEKGKQVWW